MMAVFAIAKAPAGWTGAHGRAGQARVRGHWGGKRILAWKGGVWIRLGSNVFRGASMRPESLSSPAACEDSAAHGRVGKAEYGSRIHVCECVQGSEFTFPNSES